MATIGPHEMARDLERGDDLALALNRLLEEWEINPLRQAKVERAIEALNAYADKMAAKYNIEMKK